MTYEHSLKRVRERDWHEVRRAWLSEAARLNLDPPGKPPDAELVDHVPLVAALNFPKHDVEHRVDVVGLRPAMLHEAIFLLHKAGNVLVAAHDQAVGGCATWSLATSYQAGLFAAEAMLKLLGVAIVSTEQRHFVVDVWPPPEKGLKGKALQGYTLGSEVHLIRLSSSVSHFHRWALLQRALRMASNLPFDRDVVQVLIDMEDRDFAAQRNTLHYATGWAYSDLHAYIGMPGEFSPTSKASLLASLEAGESSFGMALGTTIFLFGLRLLQDLAELAPQIAGERDVLIGAITPPRMKLKAPYDLVAT